MSGISYSMPRFQAIDQNGFPMFGATLYTYQNKTTTPAPTWRDKEQAAYNTNPIVLDARGECVVWLDPEQTYTFVLRDWYGGLVWSQDDILGVASSQELREFIKKITSPTDPDGGAIIVGRSVISVRTIDDLTSLPAKSLKEDSEYHVSSYHGGWIAQSPFRGPVGGGVFRWVNSTDLEADDGVVINHAEYGQFIRAVEPENISISMWGARCDGVSDDFSAVDAAIKFVAKQSSGHLLGNSPPNRMINGLTLVFPGIASVSRPIKVPRAAHLRLSGGGLAAHTDWIGAPSDFVLDFSESRDGRFSYDGCSVVDFTILGNKRASCLKVNRFNLFYCQNVFFRSFTEFGLDVGEGVGSGHGFFLDGANFNEYDWFDTDRDTGRTGTALRNQANDGQFRNFNINNAKRGLLNTAQGNQFDKFHIWGVEDRAWGLRNTAAHCYFHDFKLGGVTMVLENPFGVTVRGVQCERTNDGSELSFIILRAVGANIQIKALTIRDVEGHAIIGGGGGASRLLRLDETAGTFNRTNFQQCEIENLVSMNSDSDLARGVETTTTISGSTGAGLDTVMVSFASRLLFSDQANIVSLYVNDPRAEFMTATVDRPNTRVVLRNYTDETHSTPKTFSNFASIRITLTCLSS